MKKVILGAGIIILAGLGYVGYDVADRTGAFRTLDNKLVDQCVKVEVAPGAEDIQYDAETGLVFITADNRFLPHKPMDYAATPELAGNGIYALDVSAQRLEDIGPAVKVSPEGFPGFRPHGLFFWMGSESGETGLSEKRLFVVNHRTSDEAVEEVIDIFSIGEGGALTHLESVMFPDMVNPNDVVAVGPREFFATNYMRHHEDDGAMFFAEIFLALRYSSVMYFDGEEGRIVADGLASANGIGISPDNQTIYVNEWSGARVTVLDRQADNSLVKRKSISIPAYTDNVEADAQGNLWIAGQPDLFGVVDFVEGKADTASSLVERVNPQTGETETVFVSTGGELNAASSAAIAGNKLLIGSVWDSHIMVCNKP